jgi:hypothetical protein
MTRSQFRQVDAHSGEVVPVPAELETCLKCRAKQARIAELEAEKRRLIGHLAVAQAQAATATALGSGNR